MEKCLGENKNGAPEKKRKIGRINRRTDKQLARLIKMPKQKGKNVSGMARRR